jgi:hypothetical protein
MTRNLVVEPNEITREKALQIRRWRVDDEMTWRSVAQAASDLWGSRYGSNQLYGMDLCRVAAYVLGEDPDRDPWN